MEKQTHKEGDKYGLAEMKTCFPATELAVPTGSNSKQLAVPPSTHEPTLPEEPCIHATPTAERLRVLPAAPAVGGEERKVETEKTWRSAKLSTHADNNDWDVAAGEDRE